MDINTCDQVTMLKTLKSSPSQYPMAHGRNKNPANWSIEALNPNRKKDPCLFNTKGMVDRGDNTKLSINQGAIISESFPD